MGVLVRELAALYAAFAAGRAVAAAASCRCSTPTTRSGSASWLQGEVLERQLAYWRQQLAGRAARCWSCPRTARARRCRRYRGARGAVRAAARAARRAARRWRRREGATLFMALLAAFQALLPRYTGQDDVVRGHAHRRPHARGDWRG